MKMLISKLMEIEARREKLGQDRGYSGQQEQHRVGFADPLLRFHALHLAKDTRTGYEDGNINAVMDGEIDGFINAYLKMNAK